MNEEPPAKAGVSLKGPVPCPLSIKATGYRSIVQARYLAIRSAMPHNVSQEVSHVQYFIRET